jgi:hypothetical protein
LIDPKEYEIIYFKRLVKKYNKQRREIEKKRELERLEFL